MEFPHIPKTNNTDLILVYQLPKVASTAIGDGLRRYFPNVKVTHYLSSYVFPLYKQMVDYKGHGGIPVETIKSIASIVNATNEIYSIYRAAINAGQRVKIITGVRDPIDLSVSAIFHNVNSITSFHHWMYQLDPKSTISIFTKMISKFFENTYQNIPCENAVEMLMREGVNMPDWWFENEFNPSLNIDLTQHDFNYRQGYTMFSAGSLDILVFRFEDRFRILREAVGRFVGVPEIQIPTENAAEQKSYADLYKKVKQIISFPDYILDIKYNLPYVRHFYSPDEISFFRTKWSQKLGG